MSCLPLQLPRAVHSYPRCPESHFDRVTVVSQLQRILRNRTDQNRSRRLRARPDFLQLLVAELPPHDGL